MANRQGFHPEQAPPSPGHLHIESTRNLLTSFIHWSCFSSFSWVVSQTFFSMSFCLWCLLQVNYPFVTTKFWVNRARAHPMVIPDIINQVTCGFPKQSRWESAATGSSWACDSTGSGVGTGGAFGIALTFASGRLVSGGLVSGGFVLSSTFSSFGTGVEVFEAIPNVWPSWRSGDNYISLDIELTIDNWQGLSTVTVDDNWQWQNCEIATSAWHLNSLQ